MRAPWLICAPIGVIIFINLSVIAASGMVSAESIAVAEVTHFNPALDSHHGYAVSAGSGNSDLVQKHSATKYVSLALLAIGAFFGMGSKRGPMSYENFHLKVAMNGEPVRDILFTPFVNDNDTITAIAGPRDPDKHGYVLALFKSGHHLRCELTGPRRALQVFTSLSSPDEGSTALQEIPQPVTYAQLKGHIKDLTADFVYHLDSSDCRDFARDLQDVLMTPQSCEDTQDDTLNAKNAVLLRDTVTISSDTQIVDELPSSELLPGATPPSAKKEALLASSLLKPPASVASIHS